MQAIIPLSDIWAPGTVLRILAGHEVQVHVDLDAQHVAIEGDMGNISHALEAIKDY